jgi:DNA mismatch repair protein MutL
MTNINILSPHVADMIAAGEVVERPASVIKELVENSFDAGAKNVTVELRNGGATYIRVTDDGKGMSPEDAGVAFLRHATSKLRDERGLEAIGTMGFRGEALAAISAVSHIELVTRERGAGTGTRVTLSAGDIQDMDEAGCPEGTAMTVRDIFYNTPARLKFLKSDRSESSACVLAALRCALARPDVSVRCIHDGKEQFFSPGDGREDSCVYSLLGRELAASMLSVSGENAGVRATGFVSSPSAGRGNRAQQYFFCNGRFIKSALLQAAVEQAYKNTLLTGRYPACVIYLDLSFASVDVNVHPAKTEVKFTDEKKVFDTVHYAVRSALESESRTAEVKLSPGTAKVAEPKADFYRTMTAEAFRGNNYKPSPTVPEHPPASPVKEKGAAPVGAGLHPASPSPLHQPQAVYMTRPAPAAAIVPPRQAEAGFAPRFSPPRQEEEGSVPASPPVPDYRLIGEALDTYIIIQRGEDIMLIDKHACHERVIFDRLKAESREIMAQTLLAPVTLTPSAPDAEVIEANSALLSELGFEIEPYGESAYAVRTVPADIDAGDIPAAVEEICEKLRRNRSMTADETRDEILHTVACKAAIKAGWKTDERELRRLADAVVSGEVKYCPHGRPVAVTLTKKELEKQFKRIV